MVTNNAWNSQNPVQVAKGGTGVITTTAYGVICGGTVATGALQNAGAGSSGLPLVSGGASALPSYAALGIAGGGSNATSFTQSNGIVTYNGTRLVNYAGPQISTGGVLTNTTQPAFLAYLGSADNNVTGNNTAYTIGTNVALTKVFDQATNFNTNGTFTAPVSGRYFLSVTIYLQNLTVAMTTFILKIVTTSNGGQLVDTVAANTGDKSKTLSGLFNMAANDTCTFSINVIGGAGNTAGLSAASNPMATFVSGFLVC